MLKIVNLGIVHSDDEITAKNSSDHVKDFILITFILGLSSRGGSLSPSVSAGSSPTRLTRYSSDTRIHGRFLISYHSITHVSLLSLKSSVESFAVEPASA